MADSVAYLPEFQAWFSTLMQELSLIDVSKLLVYLVDSVDASALLYLGSQFDCLGYNGFKLAQDETGQREIIKQAIALHKYKGTEAAIMDALTSIGFSNVEYIKTGFDHWAKFGLLLTTENLTITEQSFADITSMVNAYKRAVCVLEAINISVLATDSLTITDVAFCQPQIMAIDRLTLSAVEHYDGSTAFDGEHNFSGEGDLATIQ